MTKRKAVTISITPDEYDSICTAFGEYFSKCESADNGSFAEEANRDGDNFGTKYKRACQRQLVKNTVKKALEYAKRSEYD